VLDDVFVSPHPDDAVFSAGGAIALAARAGRRVAVVTVFSVGDGAEARLAEDDAALARLGARAIRLGLVETPASGGVQRLFDAPDPRRVDEVRAALAPFLDGARVVAPLAIGGHVDHRAVFAACADLPNARFFEDQPYALCAPLRALRLAELSGAPPPPSFGRLRTIGAVARWWRRLPLLTSPTGVRVGPRALAPLTALLIARAQTRARPSPLALVEESLDVSPAADARAAALAAYATQWPLFFVDAADFARALGPVERQWRKP